MKNTVFAGVTVLLILTVWLSAAGIVKSESSERAKEEHYAVLEQQYVEDVREYLNKTGYPDSGVMCNRVTYEDGRREYTVFLHHRRLAGLAEEEKRTNQDDFIYDRRKIMVATNAFGMGIDLSLIHISEPTRH